MRYQIMVRHSYYAGSLTATPDYPMTDTDCDPIDFGSEYEAVAYLQDNGYEQYVPGQWFLPGTYILNHGEYARPYYEIEAKQ